MICSCDLSLALLPQTLTVSSLSLSPPVTDPMPVLSAQLTGHRSMPPLSPTLTTSSEPLTSLLPRAVVPRLRILSGCAMKRTLPYVPRLCTRGHVIRSALSHNVLCSSPSARSPLPRGSHALQPILRVAPCLPCTRAGPPCNAVSQGGRVCPPVPTTLAPMCASSLSTCGLFFLTQCVSTSASSCAWPFPPCVTSSAPRASV